MNYKNRIKQLSNLFTPNYNAFLVTDLANVRYLCGYSGSNGTMLITKERALFFTDFRYQEQSKQEVGDSAEIIIVTADNKNVLYDKINELAVKGLAVEKTMPLGRFLEVSKHYSGSLVPTEGLVGQLRRVKDADEEKLMQRAFDIADESIAKIFKEIKPGQTELQVAAKLEYYMKDLGSSMPSFDTIVAAGVNASCPHHQPTNKVIQKGEMVKIDFGAMYGGYHSDMTRTFFMGKATDKFKEIYNIVYTAQAKAIEACRVGKVCSDLDAVARKVIADAGYGDYFGHSLGHGVGLDIHETPALSANCHHVIEAGNVYTFEPGIYLPDWGGIRIEDTYLVKKNGMKRLTNTPNDLLEIDC